MGLQGMHLLQQVPLVSRRTKRGQIVAQPPRPAGGSALAPARAGAARGPLPDFAGEFAADLLQEVELGLSALQTSPGELFLELTQISRAVPLWGGFDTTVEPGQRRSRGRQRVAKGLYLAGDLEVTGQRSAELAGSLSGCAFGDPRSPWKVGLLLFTVCFKH